ncbi:hypothetical protein MNBD_GAMMA23-320 [hydrothermal vent metagenome]|uniref:HPt domain-containing protein n=1 Tax=hydrothermal vent metagenome TaxID=652676 RepID=A0A3B0ZUX5_9ZZZZ
MSLFDKELALSQAGGNAELAKELFEMLIKDLPSQQETMNKGHSQQDKQTFWDATHKIHGGTAYCGVPDLKKACKLLEDEIKKAYPSDAIDVPLKNMNSEIDRLLESASELIAKL